MSNRITHRAGRKCATFKLKSKQLKLFEIRLGCLTLLGPCLNAYLGLSRLKNLAGTLPYLKKRFGNKLHRHDKDIYLNKEMVVILLLHVTPSLQINLKKYNN
jgi:hypothetical protein